jgi:hypothetical protein
MSTNARKRAYAIAAAATTAVLAATGIGIGMAVALDKPSGSSPNPGASAPPTSATPEPTPTDSPEPERKRTDPLTGGKVSKNPVVAVKIENTAAARPQVGLSQADIVFIQEVEGAQTRLVAVYHTKFPRRLGPVRSARTTDARLLPLFGKPGLVYSGANARVQRRLEAASLVPLYRSTRDSRRAAPHNVFVDLHAVESGERLKAATSIGWTFAKKNEAGGAKADQAAVNVGNDRFDFGYAGGEYTVRWRGQRYTDGDTGKITKADNVVIMKVQNRPDGNRDVAGSASVLSDTVGSGQVVIYRDGRKIVGTWKRSKVSGALRFRNADGELIALKPGKTWVALKG